MPKIKIREQESISFASFDATENVTLVPIVYVRQPGEDLPKPTLFSNATEFQRLYSSKCSYLESTGETSEGIHGTILDRTYFMIYELLLQGMAVLVVPIDGGISTSDKIISEDQQKILINNYVNSQEFEQFKDRNIYNVKFITSGAYSNVDIGTYKKLVDLAESRGDAIALLELPRTYFVGTEEKDIVDANDLDAVVDKFIGTGSDSLKFSAAFFPWCTFTTTAQRNVQYKTMPASFAYLMAYANSVKTNSNWFAAAGTIRGLVPNLVQPKINVGEALMHYMQNDGEYIGTAGDDIESLAININPIYNAGAYGYRIWGNRVAWKKPLSQANQYMEFLNVRILMCDIKKQIFHAAMRVTFEPNDDIVWYNFKSLASSLLDRMKSGRGIKWYKWFREEIDEKATIKATITIQPIEAVESFDINIILTDQDTTVEEEEE